MRNDLALLRRAVTAVAEEGEDVETALAAVGGLSFRDPGWSLQRFCAGFCEFVHGHHSVEDGNLFPLLLEREKGDAEFRGVLERLVSDHRTLTGYLDSVEEALKALPGDELARSAATAGIERLARHLEKHLAYEEENLAPALNALSRDVPEDEFPAPPPKHFGVARESA
jgi:hypothetical protein